MNVPPGSKQPDEGLCGAFDPERGCGFNHSAPRGGECEGVNGGPGAAMEDHEIFAITWSLPRADEEGAGGSSLASAPLYACVAPAEEVHSYSLWCAVFRELRRLCADSRPEVRTCALHTLAGLLLGGVLLALLFGDRGRRQRGRAQNRRHQRD